MNNLRIVPEGLLFKYPPVTTTQGIIDFASQLEAQSIPCPSEWTAEQAVEILKITAEEWNTIFLKWREWAEPKMLEALFSANNSQELWASAAPAVYLSDLISLAPLKGLSKEEIEEIYDHYVK